MKKLITAIFMQKKIIGLLFALTITLSSCPPSFSFSLFGGGDSNNGSKILIVRIADKENEVSDITQINNALNIGGGIVLNVDVARKLDSNFDSKYAAFDKDNRFLTLPALLNFVGGQGWYFVQMQLGPQYIFVKERTVDESALKTMQSAIQVDERNTADALNIISDLRGLKSACLMFYADNMDEVTAGTAKPTMCITLV